MYLGIEWKPKKINARDCDNAKREENGNIYNIMLAGSRERVQGLKKKKKKKSTHGRLIIRPIPRSSP